MRAAPTRPQANSPRLDRRVFPRGLLFALSAKPRFHVTAKQGCFREPARRCGKPHLSPCGRVHNAGPFAQLAAVPQLTMRFPATEYAHRSRWFATASLHRAIFDVRSTPRAQEPSTDRERGGANNRRRRDGVSGQNAEPTPSARTKPGPSAMAVSNRCRRRVLPRRASLFAEPALTAGNGPCAREVRSVGEGSRGAKSKLAPMAAYVNSTVVVAPSVTFTVCVTTPNSSCQACMV